MMKQTESYGTINASEPLISKPPKDGSYTRKFMVFVGVLVLIAFGLYHTNSANSNVMSHLLSAENTLEYSIQGTLCDNRYSGDTNTDDAYYLTITTALGTSEKTKIPSAQLVPESTFELSISAALGTALKQAKISTDVEDSICVNSITVTVDGETFSNSTEDLWISGACADRQFTPCDDDQKYLFNYYFVSPAFGDWNEVLASCQEEGGELAIFDSLEEVHEIYEICQDAVASKSNSKACYLGFNDFATLNTWVWNNGDAFDMMDYVYKFDTTSWDRCGCLTTRSYVTKDAPVADCTCDYTYGLYGICQSQPYETGDLTPPTTSLQPNDEISGLDETGNKISYLLTPQDTLTYTIKGELCSSQYAGDTNINDAYYLTLKTISGTSDPVLIPSAQLTPEGTFTVILSAELGLDIRSVTINTEAQDSICVNAITVTADEYTVTNTSATDLWISNACDERTTLKPCSTHQTFTFLYYFVSSVRDSWDNVRADCQEQGGDLAIFETEAAMDVIYDLCETVIDSNTQSCYVGYEDFDTINVWKWINGKAFDMMDYVGALDTSSYDRCGCISMRSRYTEAKPLADCTCDYSHGVYGICQSEPIDTSSVSYLKAPETPKGIKATDETGLY